MSVHIELTPEASEKLRAQQRNSTIASLLISLLSLVLIGLALAFIALKVLVIEEPDISTYQSIAPPSDEIQTKEITPTLQRKQSAPSSATSKVIASQSVSAVAIPIPDVSEPTPSADFGDSIDFGAGWGNDSASDSGFGAIPAELRKRCSKADRLARLGDNGGNEQCEEAVVTALQWLKKNQQGDGSWGRKKPVAMTSLALLAYLGHCETPLSEEFGESVQNGITYLVNNNLKFKGKSASDLRDKHWVYEHSMAMYALSEAYTFCNQLNILDVVPNLKESVETGINWILKNQNKGGGWDYNYDIANSRRDTSIIAWHLQSLKAAKTTGIKFTGLQGSINRALTAIEKNQDTSGGIGYTGKRPVGGGPHHTLTGAGALCFQQHKGITNSVSRKGIAYLDKNSYFNYSKEDSKKQKADLYEHYYNTQAMINHGGAEWERYNNKFRDELIKSQQKNGSWISDGGKRSNQDTVYYTALATLMLEVYYRFLPSSEL